MLVGFHTPKKLTYMEKIAEYKIEQARLAANKAAIAIQRAKAAKAKPKGKPKMIPSRFPKKVKAKTRTRINTKSYKMPR